MPMINMQRDHSSAPQKRNFTLRVRRENHSKNDNAHYQSFQIPSEPGMTVLAALLYAKEKLDHSIAIRFSCRMASCGSCGMRINGLPRLACYTQVADLKSETVTVEPLAHYPLVRDLVTDFEDFFQKHQSVKPYIHRRDEAEQQTSEVEYAQSPRELDGFLQFSYCIKCGLCNTACPTVASDTKFTGPQALGQAYRYMSDSRDEGAAERLPVLDVPHGIWRCHFAGACSFVCPKGVDPALAIQRLRRLVVTHPKRNGALLTIRDQPQRQ
jgi:succinate dehydrogenase / fumarate reductase, iron-sulfur subunit